MDIHLPQIGTQLGIISSMYLSKIYVLYYIAGIIFPVRRIVTENSVLLVITEYAKSAGLAGRVQRKFQMSSEGVNSIWGHLAPIKLYGKFSHSDYSLGMIFSLTLT